MKLAKRLERRDRTHRKCERRFRVQLRQQYVRPDFNIHRDAKRGINCHNCRRRKHGQPKRGTGCCHRYDLPPPVRARIDGRRLCQRALRHPDDV